MSCCFCGERSENESGGYVEIEVTFPTDDGNQHQFFGAHVACFDRATADGFAIVSPFS